MARACFSSRVELDQSVDGLLFVQAGKKKKEKVKMKRETLPTGTGGEEHEFVVNVRRKEGKGRVQGGAHIKRGSVVGDRFFRVAGPPREGLFRKPTAHPPSPGPGLERPLSPLRECDPLPPDGNPTPGEGVVSWRIASCGRPPELTRTTGVFFFTAAARTVVSHRAQPTLVACVGRISVLFGGLCPTPRTPNLGLVASAWLGGSKSATRCHCRV
jgi:hypothetical protein